jgi:predicted transposase YdaD
MPHITSIERLSRQEGRQEGQQEGRQEGILDIVQARFGEVPYTLREHILALRDEAELKRLLRQSALVNSLADFCALIAQPPAQ